MKKFIKKILTIDLPYPPTLNTAYANWKGRRILSAKGKNYHNIVCCECRPAGKLGVIEDFGKDRLRVTIFVYPPDHRVRDLDNLGKLLLDGFQKAGVYENDSQIDNLTYVRCWMKRHGGVTVTIRNINPKFRKSNITIEER